MGCNLSVEADIDVSNVVTFVGLDGSGKSEIIFSLVNKDPNKKYIPISTAGLEYHELSMGSTYLKIYDCGGTGRYRDLWDQFIRQSDGVVFVIDKTDLDRMGRVREEIESVITICNSFSIPLLIFAHKTDLNSTLTKLDIESITRINIARIQYNIIESSTKNGNGLIAGRDWILQNLKPKTKLTQNVP